MIQALLLLGRRYGPAALSHQLADLIEALDRLSAEAVANPGPRHDARWWAVRLLSQTLLRVPDARPHLGVLRLLAGRVVRRAATGAPGGPGTYAAFGPWFWQRLRLSEEDRIDLFRRLVPADGPPPGEPRAEGDRSGGTCPDGGERFLDAVARRLADRPRTVQPLLCGWFTDERPLPAGDGDAMRPTVAAAAQALLYARRDLAVDELTDALVSTPHPRAGELLAALAEDEPSALCRAVHRWAHDEDRRARRTAAASYALFTSAHATLDADRGLLRGSALALLARPTDTALHGAALALLVQDPRTRDRYLPQALRAFVAGESGPSAEALAVALPSHPEPVLAAPGSPASGPLREQLLEVLLDFEQEAHRDPAVLDALLRAAATGSGTRAPARTRALVHRTGTLLVRTPEGAVRFDRRLVELARDVPGFAALITGWLADAPQEWAVLVGPSARRTVEALGSAKAMPMQAARREHGSLRPA